jgi:uncharacterized iron-regulated membrane protein
MIRKTFFWLHLAAGVVAGVVILIMSFTGVLLAWQRPIIHMAESGLRRAPASKVQPTPDPEMILSKLSVVRRDLPASLTWHSDPSEPISASYGRDTVLYINPWNGEVLGEGPRQLKAFFRSAEDWHRWLAAGIEQRATFRGITGAANLIFLGILLSGAYLWMPKVWSRQYIRPAIWFRRGKNGRARDWNWHNTIGIWCVSPLFVIVVTGVVMSYPWANDLVYRVTGSQVPGRAEGGGGRGRGGPADTSFAGLNILGAQAQKQVADWKIITMRLPANSKAPVQFQIDSGDGGRPDLRAQLTLDRNTGEVVRWEPFSTNNAGRRLRSWIRFSHTGEAGGIVGETIAAIASLGACFLVWTGISLAIRRLMRTVTRTRASAAAEAKAVQLT